MVVEEFLLDSPPCTSCIRGRGRCAARYYPASLVLGEYRRHDSLPHQLSACSVCYSSLSVAEPIASSLLSVRKFLPENLYHFLSQ